MISVWRNTGFGVDVAISVHDDYDINWLGEVSCVGACLHRHEVDQMLKSRSFAEVTHHVGLDTDSKYFAFGDALCNPHAEISGARAPSLFPIGNVHAVIPTWGIELWYDVLRVMDSSRT